MRQALGPSPCRRPASVPTLAAFDVEAGSRGHVHSGLRYLVSSAASHRCREHAALACSPGKPQLVLPALLFTVVPFRHMMKSPSPLPLSKAPSVATDTYVLLLGTACAPPLRRVSEARSPSASSRGAPRCCACCGASVPSARLPDQRAAGGGHHAGGRGQGQQLCSNPSAGVRSAGCRLAIAAAAYPPGACQTACCPLSLVMSHEFYHCKF